MTFNLFHRLAGAFALLALVATLTSAVIGNMILVAVFSVVTAFSIIIWVLSYVIALINETVARQILR